MFANPQPKFQKNTGDISSIRLLTYASRLCPLCSRLDDIHGAEAVSFNSQPVMGPVAERLLAGLLAAAEPDLLARLRLVVDRFQIGHLMAAIAEGLVLRASALAPEIALPLFDLDRIGVFLGDDGF